MADQIREILSAAFDSNLQNVSDGVIIVMAVVLGLIAIMSIFALGVQIVLAIKYIKYNRQQKVIAIAIILKRYVCADGLGKRIQ